MRGGRRRRGTDDENEKRPRPHARMPYLATRMPLRHLDHPHYPVSTMYLSRSSIAATLLACSSHDPRMRLRRHQVLDLSDRSDSHYKVDDAKSERRGKALPEPVADAHRQRCGKSDAVLLDQCLLQHYSALAPLSTVSLLHCVLSQSIDCP